MFHKLHYLLIFLHCAASPANTRKKFLPSIPEDGRLNFTELAAKYGHKSVSYDVVTQDGYILQLFRIAGDVRRPVLLLHGPLGSSDDFLLRGNRSLVAALARDGRDVWAGNVRGNRYSRRHVRLHPDIHNEAFFDYGIDDLALFDLPAMIDRVLNTTGQSQLSAIAYSEGTTMFFALGAAKPEYNDKIKVLIAMAPFFYVQYLEKPLWTLVALGPIFRGVTRKFKVNELGASNSPISYLIQELCAGKPPSSDLCWQPVYALTGSDDGQLEPSFRPVIAGHFPAGSSIKNFDQFSQNIIGDGLSRYNYGKVGNKLYYDRDAPPRYDLSKVSMRVALVVGAGDRVATVRQAAALRARLPRVVRYTVLAPEHWTHLDFLYARDADLYLFPEVFDILNTYG